MVRASRESHHVQFSNRQLELHREPSCLIDFTSFLNIPIKLEAIMLSSLGNPRQAAAQIMNFALILSTAFMVSPPLRSFESSC